MGIAEVLKEEYPHVRVVGIQPASSSEVMFPRKFYPKSEIKGGIISDMLFKIRYPKIEKSIFCSSEKSVKRIFQTRKVNIICYKGICI